MRMKPLEIFIVEDNPGDAAIIREMLWDQKIDLNVTMAEDGLEAMDLLKKKGNVIPDLIILDLNLPRMDGFEVLDLMKKDDELRSIPVVVITGSLRREDEIRARSLGAIEYCIKPSTVEEMDRLISCFRDHLRPLKN